MGYLEKTDRIDAGVIAWFAKVKRLTGREPASTDQDRLKALEAIAYAEQVGARQGFSIHDGLVNEVGLRVLDNVLGVTSKRTGREYRRLPVGDSVEL